MNITPFMKEETLPDGVYTLPDGRVFRVQPLPYFRSADPVQFNSENVEETRHAFTVQGLEMRISELLTPDSLQKLGQFLVERELEWAERELQKMLAAEKSSSMANAATSGAAIVAR